MQIPIEDLYNAKIQKDRIKNKIWYGRYRSDRLWQPQKNIKILY
jgi:hypothetical protein